LASKKDTDHSILHHIPIIPLSSYLTQKIVAKMSKVEYNRKKEAG
jgi:hypothetical protein